jgi:hypothetical protein
MGVFEFYSMFNPGSPVLRGGREGKEGGGGDGGNFILFIFYRLNFNFIYI